jgi:hypothetical protein
MGCEIGLWERMRSSLLPFVSRDAEEFGLWV